MYRSNGYMERSKSLFEQSVYLILALIRFEQKFGQNWPNGSYLKKITYRIEIQIWNSETIRERANRTKFKNTLICTYLRNGSGSANLTAIWIHMQIVNNDSTKISIFLKKIKHFNIFKNKSNISIFVKKYLRVQRFQYFLQNFKRFQYLSKYFWFFSSIFKNIKHTK